MQTPLFCLDGPTSTTVNASATRYIAFMSSAVTGVWSTSNTTVRSPIARSGTISKLRTRFDFASPLTTGTYVLVLQVDGADTGLTVTINAGESVEQDLLTEVPVTQIQDLCWKVTGSGADQVPTLIQISCLFTATTSGKSVLFGGINAGTSSRYLQVGANLPDNPTADEPNTEVVMPAAGQIDRFYVRVPTAPGAGTSRVYTVYKNGSPTGLVVTFSDTDSLTESATANTTWDAGDVLSIGMVVNGSVVSSATTFSLDWDPDTDGESLVFGTLPGTLSQSTTRYTNLNGRALNEATEASTYSLAAVDCTLRKMRAMVQTAPGGAASWLFTARKNGADQGLACSISGSNTTDDDPSEVTVDAGDRLNWSCVPSGTPALPVGVALSAVVYVAPAAAGGSNMMLMGVG